MADLLHADFAIAEKTVLHHRLDKLVEHKDAWLKLPVRRRGPVRGTLRGEAVRPDSSTSLLTTPSSVDTHGDQSK